MKNEHSNCHLKSVTAGALIGYGAAVIIDALLLARTTRSAPTEPRRWAPTFAAAPDGASLGVVGVF